MKVGRIVVIDGYCEFKSPVGVIVGSSRSDQTLTDEQAARLLDEYLGGALPVDIWLRRDRWFAVTSDDPYEGGWHSGGSGSGWRDAAVFETYVGGDR